MARKKSSEEASAWTIRRLARKKYSALEKVWIVREGGLRALTSGNALSRREGSRSF